MKKGQCDFDWTEELKKDLSSKEKLTEDNDTETFEEPMDKENDDDEVPKEASEGSFVYSEDSSEETKDIENEVSKENSGEKYTSGSEESTERFSDRICIKCKTSLQAVNGILQAGWYDRWTGNYCCSVCREEEIEGESL